jgi:beta-hydroxyacyl-ACP dehydratase FabZ
MSPSEATPVLDIKAIFDRLLHRYPFLFIDKVVELTREKIVAIKNVTFNEPFFQGHFPGEPVMPGVLLIEAMAQAGGVLIMSAREDASNKLVFLASVRSARFRRPVVPGDQVRLELTTNSARSLAPRVKGKALVDGEVAAEAEIMFAFARTDA